MGLDITEHFKYDESLGTYDFTNESSKVHLLRQLPVNKVVQVNNLPLTIISFREYGIVSLWWVIATYNNIIEVDNFDLTELNLPSLTDIRRVLK